MADQDGRLKAYHERLLAAKEQAATLLRGILDNNGDEGHTNLYNLDGTGSETDHEAQCARGQYIMADALLTEFYKQFPELAPAQESRATFCSPEDDGCYFCETKGAGLMRWSNSLGSHVHPACVRAHRAENEDLARTVAAEISIDLDTALVEEGINLHETT